MVLRFTTAGSVDDGKSTLIGRLLYDTRSLYDDQWEAVRQVSARRHDEEVDLALLTDGLRAEREQKITIDVAYRYFSTPRRKFIIADTPGHEQYTRNMVTGASTADLAVLLVDARKGIGAQTRRHAVLSSLLGISQWVVAVNKMDCVDYSQAVFEEIRREFSRFAAGLEGAEVVYIPISALRGDNVVEASRALHWYGGPTLLNHLESVDVGTGRNLVDFRFPVQYVVRPHQDFRGLAGQLVSGQVRSGQSVLVLPAGQGTRVGSILTADGERGQAVAGDSVVISLEHDIDAPRGSLLVGGDNLPQRADHLDVTVCWLDLSPLRPGGEYVLMHAARSVRCFTRDVNFRLDVNSGQEQPASTLRLNEIGGLQLATAEPVYFDPYRINRATGGFILIDPQTNNTVAAGMIRGRARPRIFPSKGAISLELREQRNGHRAGVVWFTGLSGAGKSTLARALEQELFERGVQTMFFDGDNLRQGVCADLGFSDSDRQRNVERAAWLAQLAFAHGQIAICSLISPFQKERDFARSLVAPGRFLEVHVDCDLETCARRDPKGLYRRARSGELKDFTGLTAPYEAPTQPDLRLNTGERSLNDCLAMLLERLDADFLVRQG